MSDARDEKGRFLAGNSGNGGRAKGARNKLGEEFLADMFADWAEHGADAIRRVREERPHEYLKVIAGLLPRELKIERSPLQDMSDDQLDKRIRHLASALSLELIGEDEESAAVH